MPRHILIIEDDPILAEAMASTVEDELGCMPLVANSVYGATPLLDEPVDLAILDVEVLDGVTYGLAGRLLDKGIPVIFLSGSDPARVPEDIARVPFLRKPVFTSHLLSVARQYV